MKQKNLLTRMLLLFALVVGSVTSVWAEDVTASFTVTNLSSVPQSFASDPQGFTMVVADNGGTDPAQNKGSLRLYAKNQMTISSTDGVTKFKSVTFNMKINASNGKFPLISAPSGSFSPEVTDNKATTTTWTAPTGGVSTITFTFPANSSGVGGNWTFSGVSVTYASAPSSEATFLNTTPSINFPGTTTYSQEASTAEGYKGTVEYEITANTAGATISGSTVTVTKEGSVTVKATAPAIEGSFAASTATYTLTVNDTRAANGLAFTEASQTVQIGETLTAPTLTNPNNLSVTYSSSNTEVATVGASGNVTGVAAGTATITASFAGNDDYKAGSASYTINVYDPNAKGTVYNPYTIAEVIDGTATGDGVYVKGYIVGSWQNNKFDPENLVNTNLALADSPDETDGSNTIPVELKSAYRSNFGLTDGGKAYNIGIAKVLINGNCTTYFKVKGVKELNSIEKVAEYVTISSAGMATYYTDCALDFTEFDDMYAYVATTEGTTINYKRVKKVPANTAVLLRNPNGTSASHDVPVITEGAEAVSGNQLEGTLTKIASLATDGTSESKNYILNNGPSGVGFYLANGQAVGVHRAYLNVPASVTAPFLGFNEDEGTTGINSIERTANDNQYYTLDGRRVAQPTKGLYIVNGKKVIIK